MWRTYLFKPAALFCLVILSNSCEKESEISASSENFTTTNFSQQKSSPKEAPNLPIKGNIFQENFQDILVINAVAPSECSTTEFIEVQWEHLEKIMNDPVASENLEKYNRLNRYAALLNLGDEYFGPEGEHTQLVKKIQRELERFWNMPNEIEIHGQHNATLNDREKLLDLFWLMIADVESKEDLYPMVDEILYLNSLSPNLPESPFFSSDGFANYSDLIVIGDGLIQLFTEAGIENDIAWTGILSHEWSHQVQMNHLDSWYPDNSFDDEAERTRFLELEADFFSGYYMTHKRGATFNWKRAEAFFDLFFQSGDCFFEFSFHHGTPLQRKAATYEGHSLAASAQKKGAILTPEELHRQFISLVYPKII